MNLDFDLSTPERIALISELDLSQSSQKALETFANYILHHENTLNPHRKYNEVELDPNLPEELTSKYTKPKIKIDYTLPELANYKTAIDNLKQMELKYKLSDPSKAYKLRLQLRELYQDAGIVFHSLRNEVKITPHHDQHLPELDLDFGDAFTVKQVIKFYTALVQTEREEAKYTAWVLEQAVELTPMKDWEKHIILRTIDGVSQVVLGVELAEQFGRVVSPSYLSQVLRSLYRRIAEAFRENEFITVFEQYPEYWEHCLLCGSKFMKHKRLTTMCGKCEQRIKQKGKNGATKTQ